MCHYHRKNIAHENTWSGVITYNNIDEEINALNNSI